MTNALHPIIAAMEKGYGKEFPGINTLFSLSANTTNLQNLQSPIPELGRYQKNVHFLENVTSGLNYGQLRFRVMIEYFIALSEFFEAGDVKDPIIPSLSDEEKSTLREMGTSPDDVVRAEFIERFTGHDTAAAGDYLKLRIAQKIPRLTDHVEGVHFAATSEDVIGNVTGLIGNKLIYHHFVPEIINFWRDMAELHTDLITLPAFTHKQSAEPTTHNINTAVSLEAVHFLLLRLVNVDGNFQPFSGKMGGAIGNLTCHFAAYPNQDWWKFSRHFVEGLGLHYHEMTDQCSPYVAESFILGILIDIIEQIVKFARDFCDLVSCPGQLFVKIKKEGEKGSSIMPGKTNLWATEGAIAMLRKTQNNLRFLSSELQSYPHQGNMARSYLMRSIGGDFMPAFIGIARIRSELSRCVPSKRDIGACLDKYPGMCGSSIQTALKAKYVQDDAYRIIQAISINQDGSYANLSEFTAGLHSTLDTLELDSALREKLLSLLSYANLTRPAEERARQRIQEVLEEFDRHLTRCKNVKV